MAMSGRSVLPILHFNDVYRVQQTSKQGTISADQFAAKIAQIRTKWGERSRALAFLEEEEGHQKGKVDDDDENEERSKHIQHTSPSSSDPLRGLTLFSGDVFNPSIESSVTRGEHMIEILNAMSIDCACLGNHDFDFGYPHLCKLMPQTNFPWTFSNIADVQHTDPQRGHEIEPQETDRQVDGTLRAWVTELHDGVRVGCIGLVERDWIATVPAFPPNFRYRGMVEIAKKLSKELRDPDGPHKCDLIVALTHCRLPNDIDLANALGATSNSPEDQHGVDLILGGHDHTYYIGNGIDKYEGEEWGTSMPGTEKDKSCMLVKSGTDFHDLSEIELELSEPKEGVIRRRRIIGANVRRHKTKPNDQTLPELKAHIDELMNRVDQATGQPVAFAMTSLDCRMDKVRTDEAGVGNFIADILLHSYDDALRQRDQRGEFEERRADDAREVDLAFICGGSLRGDEEFGPGIITLRDILTIMPFEDAVIVRNLKGKDILEALENGLGAYPSQEGRFPQVAGISVDWDSSRPPGQRVVEVRLLKDVHLFDDEGKREVSTNTNGNASPATEGGEGAETYAFERKEEGGYSIEVNKPRIRKGAKLDPDRVYRVVTREYMGDGHDGYAALNRACGEDLVDHENGSLMSTQVRKFLLGASLIWRLKAFRDQAKDDGLSVVGQKETLSHKTRKAIERAHALSDPPFISHSLLKSHNPSAIQATSAGAESAHAAQDTKVDSGKATPKKAESRRVVVDSSPGAFRDAMHVGASEHHSHYDAASKHFRDSRIPANARLRSPLSASSLRNDRIDRSIDSVLAGDDGGMTGDDSHLSNGSISADEGEQDSSNFLRELRRRNEDELAEVGSVSSAGDNESPSAFRYPTSASTMMGSNDDLLMAGSSYFSPKAIRKHVEVTAEDGALLRSSEGSLAIIAPMRDGRLVDLSRIKTKNK
ncbi:hypothetical protein L7F22_019813 [Adiantum nelumboides]|nr:hypothetical protein [Adiantum nelumboides]